MSNKKATQSVLDKFVSGPKPLPLNVGRVRTLVDVKCEGFGKLIGVNCFNSNESRFIISDATYAWSKECLKVTKCQDKVCYNCKELMKSDVFRKKAFRVKKSENNQMKHKPYSCFPPAARNSLKAKGSKLKKTKKSLQYTKEKKES